MMRMQDEVNCIIYDPFAAQSKDRSVPVLPARLPFPRSLSVRLSSYGSVETGRLLWVDLSGACLLWAFWTLRLGICIKTGPGMNMAWPWLAVQSPVMP